MLTVLIAAWLHWLAYTRSELASLAHSLNVWYYATGTAYRKLALMAMAHVHFLTDHMTRLIS